MAAGLVDIRVAAEDCARALVKRRKFPVAYGPVSIADVVSLRKVDIVKLDAFASPPP